MKILLSVITVAYPVIVYLSLTNSAPSLAVTVLIAALSLRGVSLLAKKRIPTSARLVAGAIIAGSAYLLCSLIPSSPLFYPVLVSGALCAVFALSLRKPLSIIEAIATSLHGPLPAEGHRYCRTVTKVWSAFFAVNFLIALDSTYRSIAWWSLYNGLLSYCAIGILFGVEYLVRRRVMKRLATVSAILASLFVSLPAFSQTLSLEELRHHLKPPAPFRTSFTEKRFITVLTAPLESRGEMDCIPGKGLIWRTVHPVAKTSIITPDGITLLSESHKPQALSDRANISEALLSLMSGDTETASQSFTIVASGTMTDWALTLTPTDSLVAEILEKIVVRGRERPEAIEISHTNQDRIVTSFSSPTTLSPSDLAKAQETLHEAL